MKLPLRILHLEDDPNDVKLIQSIFEAGGIICDMMHVETRADFISAIEQGSFNLILTDHALPSFDGLSALKIAREKCPDVPFIFVSGTLGEELAIETLKSGATDYVLKDRLSRLVPTVHRALREAKERVERKQVEEALLESEERLRLLVEGVKDYAIFMLDTDGHIISWNAGAERIKGYTAEEIIGKHFSIFYPDEDIERGKPQRGLDIAARDGRYEDEGWRVRRDGSRFWANVVIRALRDSGGNLRGFSKVTRDITERKRSEEQIREQATLLDKAQDAIVVQDLKHCIIYWNKSAEHLYGWTAEEAIGKNANELLYKKDSSQLIEAHKSVLEREEWMGELYQITKGSREAIVESRWTLVRDSEGKPKSILLINTNITDKKKLEAQFLRIQRMESIGILAGGIAHDLNNILAPIMMSLELLRKKITDEKSQSWFNMLEVSTQRGANLVKQILSFAREPEGDHTIIQVRYIISEIEKILQETFPKSIEISTDMPRDLWTVSGNLTQLHQVLMNLCVNSRDAMPSGGRLSISAENFFIDENYTRMNIDARVGPYTVITVSDTGVGISPEILDRIFEPFFTTKEPGKGTGLGLSTAFGIVKSHGGFIHVYSELGNGTQFRIYLPAIEITETLKVAEREPQLSAGHGELILVVDDEASLREISRLTLEKHGYRVITANDGVEAVALYLQNREEIEAVILDMMMPIMDGFVTIRALRKIDPKVKVIAVSGLKENGKIAEVTGAKVDAFSSKPYTGDELLKTLHEVLSLE